MKKRKSFSRFLLWILIILEGLSLAVVIGFLYAMLVRSVTREHHHQIEMQTSEVHGLLTQRRDLLAAKIEEIAFNNSVNVSLLLDMDDKGRELMEKMYPVAGGMSFFLRYSTGKIVPEPSVADIWPDRLVPNNTGSHNMIAHVQISPQTTAAIKAVRRDQKLLGHVIGVYDMTEDTEIAQTIRTYPHLRLMAKLHDRYLDVCKCESQQTAADSESSRDVRFGVKAAGFSMDALKPIQGFANLFLAVSHVSLAAKKWDLIVNLIWLVVPLFGLTLTVSFLILKKVTSSINAMARNAMAIAEGSSPQNLDEQQVQHIEFLHLAQAFNKVLSKVRRRTEELRRHQQHLDLLVEERTAELHASNRKLTQEVAERVQAQLKLSKSKQALVKALDKLKQTQAQMIHSEKMASIGQLAAGVAHEINNPIGFIKSNLFTLKGYCEEIAALVSLYDELAGMKGNDNGDDCPVGKLLRKVQEYKNQIDYDFIKEELAEVLEESKEGLERVAGIVRDLKDFSHTNHGKIEYSDINRGLETALKIVWNQLKYTATVNKDLGEIPAVMCDLEKLNQVFLNLLINAGQAINRKGTIDISTRFRDNQVEIKISDDGCGIPPDDQSKIFDPFFTTKAVGKGTGLGLNLVYNIIKSHNGFIGVKSEVGQGTTFTIRLDVEGQCISS